MDIKCDFCNTVYDFDKSKIPSEGIRVKCEVCQNIFLVKPDSEQSFNEELSSQLISDENNPKEFMIRQTDGNILRFTALEQLHNWILEDLVHSEDEISSTGETWAKLSDLPDLEEIFNLARERQADKIFNESTIPIQREPSLSLENLKSNSNENQVEPEFENTAKHQFQTSQRKTSTSQRKTSHNYAKIDEDDLVITPDDSNFDDSYKKPSKLPWIIATLVLVIGISVGSLFHLKILTLPSSISSDDSIPEQIIIETSKPVKQTKQKPQQNNYESNYKQALKSFELGSVAGYLATIKLLENCKSSKCISLRSLSLALWAYYLNEDIITYKNNLPKKLKKSLIKKRIKIFKEKAKQKASESLHFSEQILSKSTNDHFALYAQVISSLILKKKIPTKKLKLIKKQNNAYAVFTLAFILKNKKQYNKAIKLLEAVPNKPFVLLYELAHIKRLKKNLKDAAIILNSLCNNQPEHTRACQEAITLSAYLPKVIHPNTKITDKNNKKDLQEDNNADFDTYYSKAEQYYKIGNKNKALRYYIKALKKDPTSVDSLNGAGWCGMDLNKPSIAIKYFKKALAIAPAFSRARYGLAEALRQNGNTRSALTQYKKYLAANPVGGRHIPRVKLLIKQLENKLGISSQPTDTNTNNTPSNTSSQTNNTNITIVTKQPNTKTEESAKTEKPNAHNKESAKTEKPNAHDSVKTDKTKESAKTEKPNAHNKESAKTEKPNAHNKESAKTEKTHKPAKIEKQKAHDTK